MHRDDILRMAHEAGWSGVFVEWAKQPDEQFPVEKSLPVPVTMEQIERFAALVAAAERDKIQASALESLMLAHKVPFPAGPSEDLDMVTEALRKAVLKE